MKQRFVGFAMLGPQFPVGQRARLVVKPLAAERCCYRNALYIGPALHNVSNLIFHIDQQRPQHCPAHLRT